ncbi:hypothetical protein [Burkholderia sp. BE17]|uniref:hypothetical protein n=1 Tax=Burkholderia sp. BE17 TaxID=2656644 RepID=UPI00128AFFCE|nr:hypothetical protein [Burkholderia sp. BE17]MPV67995.1 hypothetical protein [Burkholderia sp. BE17]
MNLSLHTAVLLGLTLALVAMYALGFYWLVTRQGTTLPQPRVTPSPALTAAVYRSRSGPGDSDEWGAFAPHTARSTISFSRSDRQLDPHVQARERWTRRRYCRMRGGFRGPRDLRRERDRLAAVPVMRAGMPRGTLGTSARSPLRPFQPT